MQIGQKILRLDTIDSTNNYIANLIKTAKVAHGTVILADEQTAGRGQRGAVWTSKAGENILLSLYVTPDNLSVENQVVLTHFASVAIVEVLRKIGISAQVKWPNDIYVNGKKIAGILIENTIVGGLITQSIIGIGLNVNQNEFQNLIGTSIRIEKNEFTAIENVLFMLIHELNVYWDSIKKGDFQKLRRHYLDLLFLLNKEASFEDSKGLFMGIIRGISNEGLLRIERSGAIQDYNLKEIRFIGQNEI